MSVTVKQAARMLNCKPARIRKMIRRGTLKAVLESDPHSCPYSGNLRYLISRESLEAADAAGR